MTPLLPRTFRKEIVPTPPRSSAATRDLRLRHAIDGAPVGLALSAVDGHWLWFNKACCTTLGYTREELLRITLRDITHPDDAPHEIKLLRALLQGDIPHYRLRKRVMDKRGSYRTIHASAALVQVNPGEPWLVVHSIEPAALDGDTAHDADRLSTLILNRLTHAAVIRMDTRGIITGWNRGAAAIFGYKPEEVAGRNRSTLYRDQDNWVDSPTAHLRAAAENGSHENDDWRVRRDGTHIWVTSTITRYSPDGSAGGFVEVITPAIEQQTIDPSAAIKGLQDELEKERQKNAALQTIAARLKTAETLHLRELRILAGALRKERTQRQAEAVVEPTVEPAVASAATEEPLWQLLGEGSLFQVISGLEEERRNGLLALSNGRQHLGIYLTAGRIVSCASSENSATLGERLVAWEWISEAQRRKTLETCETTGLPFGRALLLHGFLDESRVIAALRQKIKEDSSIALQWTDALWTFMDQPQGRAKLVEVSFTSAEFKALLSTPETATRLVASSEASKYHLPTCPSAVKIAVSKRIFLDDSSGAEARGLQACRLCHPVDPPRKRHSRRAPKASPAVTA